MSTAIPSEEFGSAEPTDQTAGGRAEFRLWKACAWAGPVYIVGVLVCWAGIAGFIPPPRQDWNAIQTAAFYADNEVAIRLGMEGVMIFALFYCVWSLAVARVMRRSEGRERILSTIQLVGGIGNAWVTMACAALWLTASFRAAVRPAESTALLNDLAWIVFDVTGMTLIFQMVAYGVLILTDGRRKPLMPRWLAYASFWLAATFFSVYLMPSFNTGPFSWGGLLTLYVALGSFTAWVIIASWYTFSAIRRIEQDERVSG